MNQLYLEAPQKAWYAHTHRMFLYGDKEIKNALASHIAFLYDVRGQEFLEYDERFILAHNYCTNSGKGAWELCLTNKEKAWHKDQILLRFENLKSFVELMDREEFENREDYSWVTQIKHMRMDNLEYSVPDTLFPTSGLSIEII